MHRAAALLLLLLAGAVSAHTCGNGLLELPYERCDDNNTRVDDGCNDKCEVERMCSCTNMRVGTASECSCITNGVLALLIIAAVLLGAFVCVAIRKCANPDPWCEKNCTNNDAFIRSIVYCCGLWVCMKWIARTAFPPKT